jgi:hypothetical protein
LGGRVPGARAGAGLWMVDFGRAGGFGVREGRPVVGDAFLMRVGRDGACAPEGLP